MAKNCLRPDSGALIFVSFYFQFYLHAEAVMTACFSFIIKGIKEALNGFSKIVNYVVIFSGSLSFNRRFLYAKQSVLSSFIKVR